MKRLLPLLLLLNLPMAAPAGESEIRLKDGPGKDLVAARCSLCHSLDYIPMNSPFLDPKGWKKEVDKMVKAMGAPVAADEIPAILQYLDSRYGKQR